VARAFEVLGRSLGPFIDEAMEGYFADELHWAEAAANRLGRPVDQEVTDPLFQLLVLRRFWGPVFAPFFGQDLRGLIGQLVEDRNRWAHFSLPDDPAHLDRCVLAIERLVAPVDPDAVSGLRVLRGQLRRATDADQGGDGEHRPGAAALAAQLSEAEAAFEALQSRYADLAAQLEASRRAAASKQLRLSTAEHLIEELEGRSTVLESTIVAERDSRARVEWLFVALITVLLLVMVLIAS
jgi:hypothetical protein